MDGGGRLRITICDGPDELVRGIEFESPWRRHCDFDFGATESDGDLEGLPFLQQIARRGHFVATADVRILSLRQPTSTSGEAPHVRPGVPTGPC